MRETECCIYFYRKSIFSNFYETKIEFNNHIFFSSEQAFMFRKAELFGDFEIAEKILKVENSFLAKDLGRSVSNFDENIWNINKFNLMVWANILKFSQNQEIFRQLLATGNKLLVEASPTDLVWGVGLEEDDDKILDCVKWRGQNLFGRALNEVRSVLRDGAPLDS